jgi:hypothetical protein
MTEQKREPNRSLLPYTTLKGGHQDDAYESLDISYKIQAASTG